MTLHELFARDGSWTQGAEAINGAGVRVAPGDPAAVAWCLLGAVQKCYHGRDERYDIIARLCRAVYHSDWAHRVQVAAWNDAPERTMKDVRELVHRVGI